MTELSAPSPIPDPDSPTEDLSGGKVPVAQRKIDKLGIDAEAHYQGLEHTLFNTALCFAFLLFLAAVLAVAFFLVLLSDRKDLHWHFAIVIASMMVPPTVIVLGLMRAVYNRKSADAKKDEALLPLLTMVKEIMSHAKDLFKS